MARSTGQLVAQLTEHGDELNEIMGDVNGAINEVQPADLRMPAVSKSWGSTNWGSTARVFFLGCCNIYCNRRKRIYDWHPEIGPEVCEIEPLER